MSAARRETEGEMLHRRIVEIDKRMVGKVVGAGLGEELHRVLKDAADALKPQARCVRCGNPFGDGGHGPGFCIDFRSAGGVGDTAA